MTKFRWAGKGHNWFDNTARQVDTLQFNLFKPSIK